MESSGSAVVVVAICISLTPFPVDGSGERIGKTGSTGRSYVAKFLRFTSLTFKHCTVPERKGVKVMAQPSGDEGKKKCGPGSDPDDIEYVDGDMAKAMAHPLRIQIIAALNKRVMSPSGFSRTYDQKLQN